MPWPRDTQVTHMEKKVELPVSEPVYSTYQYQGSMAGLLRCNPSLRNWYLNHALMLRCNRKFLTGYTTPEVDVVNSSWRNAPEVTEKRYSSEHLDGHIHYAVRSLLNDGYYVYYTGLDDFYIPGKSWYHEQHFYHDGLICGYDQTEKHTACMRMTAVGFTVSFRPRRARSTVPVQNRRRMAVSM